MCERARWLETDIPLPRGSARSHRKLEWFGVGRGWSISQHALSAKAREPPRTGRLSVTVRAHNAVLCVKRKTPASRCIAVLAAPVLKANPTLHPPPAYSDDDRRRSRSKKYRRRRTALDLEQQQLRQPHCHSNICFMLSAAAEQLLGQRVWLRLRVGMLQIAAPGHQNPPQNLDWTSDQEQDQCNRWSCAHVFLPLVRGPRLTVLHIVHIRVLTACTKFHLRPEERKQERRRGEERRGAGLHAAGWTEGSIIQAGKLDEPKHQEN
ncbi:uncharacterized protein [Labrus bergylta]|uniref:uncharacterized protein n=1 Tax=Labrus bergylta TaxID=56723 RepID=UPI00331316F7